MKNVSQGYSVKKMYLQISQSSQKNICASFVESILHVFKVTSYELYHEICFWVIFSGSVKQNRLNTGHKMNVHQTLKRYPGHFLSVLCSSVYVLCLVGRSGRFFNKNVKGFLLNQDSIRLQTWFCLISED